jgi:hypothetical protein
MAPIISRVAPTFGRTSVAIVFVVVAECRGWHVPEPRAKGVVIANRESHAHRWELWTCHPTTVLKSQATFPYE